MPNVRWLTFDVGDAGLRVRDTNRRAWVTDEGVAIQIEFFPDPPDWPFDLTELEAARDYCGRECVAQGGVMLSLDPVAAAGAEALRGLFKYRAPVPDSLGMYYVGILWVPFQSCCFRVSAEAVEQGTTGDRETAVASLLGDAWPGPRDEPTRDEARGQEPIETLRAVPVRVLPSDDEEFDTGFPDHPLTLVRSTLAHILSTAKLDPAIRGSAPFRLPRG